ncbi:hypothetical protein BYT27DRAFT_7224774 [Phlegmacium glaucopus]|nr:hypothetical protein BYT27DRAFT_7224774 [Phlegmacium glaucopus]
MCHHINPRSVASYLSGISQQLKPYFPTIREAQHSPLVEQTLKGSLTPSDLDSVIHSLQHSNIHNDRLFLAMLLTGFFALLRLGELSFPNKKDLQNWQKISKCSSVHLTPEFYKFQLPSHKADHFFKGNHIIVTKDQFPPINPLFFFQCYLISQDSLFPLASPLWITSDGSIPTRHFFMSRLHHFFSNDISGHSMRASGATSLAENGIPPSII